MLQLSQPTMKFPLRKFKISGLGTLNQLHIGLVQDSRAGLSGQNSAVLPALDCHIGPDRSGSYCWEPCIAVTSARSPLHV